MAGAGVTTRTTPGLLTTPQQRDPDVDPPEPGYPQEAGQGENDDGDVLLEGEELFMTLSANEKEAWEIMMAEKTNSLTARKEKFEKWYDGFTRRRMFAYARARKLHEAFRQKAAFYVDLANYLSAVEAKVSDRNENKGQVKVGEDQIGTGDDSTVQVKTVQGQQQRQQGLQESAGQTAVNHGETVVVQQL